MTLFEFLKAYGERDLYPFHMPGHKRRLAPPGLENVYRMDVTEVEGTDDLHNAQGILKDAQDFAACLYGSEETYFVVNGSTGALLAAIAAACCGSGRIIAARNCHASVYHAIEVLQLNPVYIYPEINGKFAIAEGIRPEAVREAIRKAAPAGSRPLAGAVVITSPTYPGVVSDIRKIAQICHESGFALIVDEAHGAHLPFSNYFPESAVSCGADLVIQSTHKTLPAMTQTALLHVNGKLVDRQRVRDMLDVFESSSPSYILMGSIDASMHMMQERGGELFDTYTRRLTRLRAQIHELRHFELPEAEDFGRGTFDLDRSKLVLSVRRHRLNGAAAADWLRRVYHLETEMAEPDYVLAMTTVGDDEAGFARLIAVLRAMDTDHAFMDAAALRPDQYLDAEDLEMPEMRQVMPSYKAAFGPAEEIELDRAVGRCSAGCIYLYPPDVPIAAPGEEITEETVRIIRRWLRCGFQVRGCDGRVRVVKDYA